MMPIKWDTTPFTNIQKHIHILKMAPSLLILSLSVLLVMISPSEGCGINIYWGQNGFEKTLKDACDTGDYKYVSLAFLTQFGCDLPPILNLAGHCDPPSGTCKSLSSEVAYCQSKGIQVLLSLGGSVGAHSICSPADAKKVADYLWTTFLAGSGSGPLGPVALDGVDFDIEGGSNLYWDDLAKALSDYSTAERKVYLSAAPQCFFPDYSLDTALRTGLFDYVWVQFYNNRGCDIRSGVDGLLKSWNQWSAYVAQFSAETQLFMGLPASPDAAPDGGYIEPQQLNTDILPVITKTANYGGLMLWNRFADIQNNYSPRLNGTCPDSLATTLPHQHLLISQV